MKRTYIIPSLSVVLIGHEAAFALSGISSDKGIGYGGVDANGEKDPDVKGNSFDFEWE